MSKDYKKSGQPVKTTGTRGPEPEFKQQLPLHGDKGNTAPSKPQPSSKSKY